MRILLDMNIPLIYKTLLEEKGLEILRWRNIGAPTAADTEIMAYARDQNLIVLTCDLDFSAILSATREIKPSIVQIRASIRHANKVADLITAAVSQYADELKKGAVLSIDEKKARLRLLPLW